MRSTKAAAMSIASLLQAKVAIIAATPLAAWAAEQTMRSSASELSALTWLFIVGFSFLGWAVSDLDKVAELWNVSGKNAYEIWKLRFTLAKTIAASAAAGVCMFFLGSLAPSIALSLLGVQASGSQIPEMLLLIFTTGAGYMGARWFDWFEKKFFTKA